MINHKMNEDLVFFDDTDFLNQAYLTENGYYEGGVDWYFLLNRKGFDFQSGSRTIFLNPKHYASEKVIRDNAIYDGRHDTTFYDLYNQIPIMGKDKRGSDIVVGTYPQFDCERSFLRTVLHSSIGDFDITGTPIECVQKPAWKQDGPLYSTIEEEKIGNIVYESLLDYVTRNNLFDKIIVLSSHDIFMKNCTIENVAPERKRSLNDIRTLIHKKNDDDKFNSIKAIQTALTDCKNAKLVATEIYNKFFNAKHYTKNNLLFIAFERGADKDLTDKDLIITTFVMNPFEKMHLESKSMALQFITRKVKTFTIAEEIKTLSHFHDYVFHKNFVLSPFNYTRRERFSYIFKSKILPRIPRLHFLASREDIGSNSNWWDRFYAGTVKPVSILAVIIFLVINIIPFIGSAYNNDIDLRIKELNIQEAIKEKKLQEEKEFVEAEERLKKYDLKRKKEEEQARAIELVKEEQKRIKEQMEAAKKKQDETNWKIRQAQLNERMKALDMRKAAEFEAYRKIYQTPYGR